MMIGIVSLVTQGLGQGMEVVIEFAQEIFELFKYIYGSIWIIEEQNLGS